MLDIKFIRENAQLVRDAARKKRIEFDVQALIELDDARRAKITEVEAMRAELNTVSDLIPKIQDESEKTLAIEKMREFKKKLVEKERELTDIQEKYQQMMYGVPNIPDPSVPDGASDADNQEVRMWGKMPEFLFTPKDHITLLKDLDLVDFERGVKVSGFRGYFLKREAALLSMALWQLAMSELAKKGFIPLLAPSLVRENNFIGTGYLPQGKEEIYATQDDLFLIGTSEVAVMGMYQDEIFKEEDLPKKFVAFSPCFRREAGSHGKDTKGLYRVHEFMKVEQVILCRADHVESVRLHEEITNNAEGIMRALGLHYRVVANCGGDLGLGQVKKYDIEAWVPSQQKFGETHSASYFHDFQTRRLNIRYRDAGGDIHFAHSLNSTAIPTPRPLISLLEQNQKEDGSITIPEALWPYTGFHEIRRG
jgi:seryl-tRNA synthetase